MTISKDIKEIIHALAKKYDFDRELTEKQDWKTPEEKKAQLTSIIACIETVKDLYGIEY